jgi:uncharacterized protein GlcG (DUF336 family)
VSKPTIMKEASMNAILPGLVLGLVVGVSAARADALPREAVLPLVLADKAVHAALDACTAGGYRVSVAVVDRSGVVRAQLRADGAGVHTVDSSRRKAYTAASLRRPTTELAERIAGAPALRELADLNEQVLMLGGGLPIELEGEVVGGIGVGGAPGADLDDDCARAGLAAIGAASR